MRKTENRVRDKIYEISPYLLLKQGSLLNNPTLAVDLSIPSQPLSQRTFTPATSRSPRKQPGLYLRG